jgi:3-hydroxyacyl-CoA dehydrogenase
VTAADVCSTVRLCVARADRVVVDRDRPGFVVARVPVGNRSVAEAVVVTERGGLVYAAFGSLCFSPGLVDIVVWRWIWSSAR